MPNDLLWTGYFRGIRPGLIEAARAASGFFHAPRYFRGIRPGLIEARATRALSAACRGYFRGIRPGLIEASLFPLFPSKVGRVFPGHPPRPH